METKAKVNKSGANASQGFMMTRKNRRAKGQWEKGAM
jgi:hypothetical protein